MPLKPWQEVRTATTARPLYGNTLEEACRLAIADEDWWDQKHDYDNSGPTYVSGAWAGPHAPYQGDPLPVPPQFDESTQRKADHFGTLLALRSEQPGG
jgi:hypothetical protein